MFFLDCISIYSQKYDIRLFQVVVMYCISLIKVKTLYRDILVDDINLKKQDICYYISNFID